MKKELKNNKGFSLVELIVVIAIMAVLVGVLAPQFMKYVESSRQSTDIDNLQSMKTAIETEATEQLATGTFTITVDGTNKTATAAKTGDTSWSLSTMKSTINLKSDGWTGSTYTYNASEGTWSYTAVANNKNNKSTKNLDTVFEDSKAVTQSTQAGANP
jgi:type IV pilus assembly protein PilA